MRLSNLARALAAGGVLSVAGAVAPAWAQDGDLRDQVSEIAAQVQARLLPLAQALDVSLPDVREQMDPLIRAAVPAEEPDAENWAFDMNFEVVVSVTDNGEAPADNRETVFNDAQACMVRYPEGGPVVHFRRIRLDGLRGHQCVLAGFEGDHAVLTSHTYVEGPDRHMNALYVATAEVEDDPAALLALVDPVVESNIALASAIADLGVAALPTARVRKAD
jgi:hypothetical protein